jgi:hypothetical protein
MSKPKPIQISIPKPCTENWDEMTPSDKGRFCAHCQKTVIDFTSWTDTALYEYLEKNKEHRICGRFRKTQTEHQLLPTHPIQTTRLNRWVAGVGLTIALVAGIEHDAYARAPYVHVANAGQFNLDDTSDEPQGSSDSIIIRGVTIDSITRKPLRNIEVYLLNEDYIKICGTTTNDEGEFKIQISKPKGKQELRISAEKYEDFLFSSLIKLDKNNINTFLVIEIKEEIFMGLINTDPHLDIPMQPPLPSKKR